MATDEQDKWDGIVDADCPKCKAVIQLQQATVERADVNIHCPECGTSFDYQRPR
jgi:predicted Zn finger-like uncharacterized protein